MSGQESDSLIPVQSSEVSVTVDTYSKGLEKYLRALGLPTEGVLVSVKERGKVLLNLPDVVNLIEVKARRNSFYVSKFVAACGAGLFDAALNFVWDETVNNLREKVAKFDLEYFYNSTITDPERRKKLNTADDLEKIDDWELVRGCHLTGILSDLGFRHLDYIRNMRNWASAAHPNQNELTGLQVTTWLETCIREVIAKEPSGPAIEVRRLLHNLRNHTLVAADVPLTVRQIELLPADLTTSLGRTLFGMYTDPAMSATTKQNIKLIAAAVWRAMPEATRFELGMKYSVFAANAEIPRRDAANEFLQAVDGLGYLPPDTLAVELNEKIQDLYAAHTGWNNFHSEPVPAKALSAYIPKTGVIPQSVRFLYIKTLVMCAIGNGYGVSTMAQSYYTNLIARFQDEELWNVAHLLRDSEFASRLQFSDCVRRFRSLIAQLRGRTANPTIIAAMDFIASRTDAQLPNAGKTTEMEKLLKLS